MKIQKITFIAFIIFGIVIAWLVYDWVNPNYEKCFKQNSEEFANNRIKFENLIKDIKFKYLKKGEKPNLTELSKAVSKKYKEKLEEIGIENVEISYNEELKCIEKTSYKFNVKSGYNIRKLRVVQIIYSPCDEQTRKGFHENSGLIDINGEGNNWLIFSDTDFI